MEEPVVYQAGRPKLIELRLAKYRLYLTEQEITRLLAQDPDLWKEAVRRGKAITRVRRAGARTCITPARCREPSGPS